VSALRPGLCSVTFRALAYGEVLTLAREAGVEGIEWGADVHAPPGDLSRARAIASESAARGIAVASYGSYVEAGASDPDAFASVIETALALGAPNVRVWAGKRGVASRSAPDEERRRAAEELRAFADAAASAGLTVSLEFHRETLTDSVASTLDLLGRVDRPNACTYWQPRPGLDGAAAASELSTLRPNLSHLHVFHWNLRRERFPLAESAAFWQPLLAAVAGWDDPRFPCRWAMIEFVRSDDPGTFLDDARALRGWVS